MAARTARPGALGSTDWRDLAACLDLDPELFFPIGDKGPALAQTEQAVRVCRRCAVTQACLDFALEQHQDAGVWGGRTEEERRNAIRLRSGAQVGARRS